jgi:hypothetical protein
MLLRLTMRPIIRNVSGGWAKATQQHNKIFDLLVAKPLTRGPTRELLGQL